MNVRNVLKHELYSSPSTARRRWLEENGFPVHDRRLLQASFFDEMIKGEAEVGFMYRPVLVDHDGEPFLHDKVGIIRWYPCPEKYGDSWLSDAPEGGETFFFPTLSEAVEKSRLTASSLGYYEDYHDACEAGLEMLP